MSRWRMQPQLRAKEKEEGGGGKEDSEAGHSSLCEGKM